MANLDKYFEEGETLYKGMAGKDDVFDPNHPKIPMFDKGEQWNPEYLSASRKKVSDIGNMSPRKDYFTGKMTELHQTLSPEDQRTATSIHGSYGSKPRFKKTDTGYNLASPYSFEQKYREESINLDRFDQIDLERGLSREMKALPTDTTSVERKVMDSMLKQDEAPWQKIEDPIERYKAKIKARDN
jgi:hypothetical protein